MVSATLGLVNGLKGLFIKKIMSFNKGDYQGRSKRQVVNNYKITFISLCLVIIFLFLAFIFSIVNKQQIEWVWT